MQNTSYQNLIIGFGKAGKTLAGFLAKKGETVALVERSKERYGGTCINVACIPSKSLEYSARLSAAAGGAHFHQPGRTPLRPANQGRGREYPCLHE